MADRWEFHVPTKIRFGPGSLRKLGEEAKRLGNSGLLVGYRECKALKEAYVRAAKSMNDAGLRVTEFLEVEAEPPAESAAEGARAAVRAGVDLVVGLGGGSPLDVAKGIAVLVRSGGSLWDYTRANPRARPAADALPILAVPTTSGTGSEVTQVAVFTHYGRSSLPESALKAPIVGPALVPKVALVDPGLSAGAPPGLTAACGVDALGHAVEAWTSRRANPISAALAARAVALVLEHLPRAVEAPDDPGPRGPLALASTLAGAAFSTTSVTLPHAMAHALGGVLDVAHGEAIAIATPLSLRYNAECCREAYCRLAEACGIPADSPARQADRFVERIVELIRCVGLPDRVSLPQRAPEDLAARLARNAVESMRDPLAWNPRPVDEATLVPLFEEIL